MTNMVSYLVVIGIIIMVGTRGIRRTGFEYTFDTKVLLQSTIVFFIVVPFVVSGISIIVAPYIGMEQGLGFSGIVFAFAGYLIFILETLLVKKTRIMKEQGNRRQVAFGSVLSVVIIVIPIAAMIPGLFVNWPAHLAGFVSGLITPFLLTAAQKK